MPPKKSILFTIPNFITAGLGYIVFDILKRLNRDKYSPAVCVMKKGGKLDKEIEKLGIPLLVAPFTVPVKPYTFFLGKAWKAAQNFRHHKFDLWHSFHYLDDYSEPIIARLAGTRNWVYSKTNMNWRRRSWYVRTFLATRVVAVNSTMMQVFFSNIIFRRKAHLIPFAMDASRFHPDTPCRLNLRENYRIPPKTPIVTCVAHLLPVKGQDLLIRAMGGIPEAHVFLAGRPSDDGYPALLKNLANSLGIEERVHFLGPVDDVPALLAESDIFVLPTRNEFRSEALGVALLEAMATGKPCIVSGTPGPKDVVQQGINGFIFPSGNENVLAEKLDLLIKNDSLRKSLGEAARKRVLEHYTAEKEVASLEALYEELIH